jgi:hypothetical protein
VSFAAITLFVAPPRAVPEVSVYFVIDSVRKLLDTPSYTSVWTEHLTHLTAYIEVLHGVTQSHQENARLIRRKVKKQ